MTPAELAKAECRIRGLHVNVFFPIDCRPVPEAVEACRVCPVSDACAAERGDDMGMRAGVMVLGRPDRRYSRKATCRICGAPYWSTGTRNTLCGAVACAVTSAEELAEWNRTRAKVPNKRHRDGLGRWAS